MILYPPGIFNPHVSKETWFSLDKTCGSRYPPPGSVPALDGRLGAVGGWHVDGSTGWRHRKRQGRRDAGVDGGFSGPRGGFFLGQTLMVLMVVLQYIGQTHREKKRHLLYSDVVQEFIFRGFAPRVWDSFLGPVFAPEWLWAFHACWYAKIYPLKSKGMIHKETPQHVWLLLIIGYYWLFRDVYGLHVKPWLKEDFTPSYT